MISLPKATRPSYLVFAILIMLSITACEKQEAEIKDIDGTYCTYRDGINGPVSSEVSIVVDTTDRNDFLISNISGYTNSSAAFLEVGVQRLSNRLVIFPYDVLLGNGNEMTIEGQGNINSDKTIEFEISITQDEVSSYQLFLNSDINNILGDYSSGSNKVSLGMNETTFALSDNDLSYNFKMTQIENNGCGITIPRQTAINTATNEEVGGEAELFYTGEKLIGELRISTDNWQTIETFDLNLQ